MKEDSIDDLKKRISVLEQSLQSLERQLRYQDRVLAVLVAVGILPQRKLEEAREIVSSLAD